MKNLKNYYWIFILAILVFVIIGQRYHTRYEPLERDMTAYAVVANELLHGKFLYADIFEQKPPAIHLTYAAAQYIFGYNRNTIFILTVITALLTLPGIYLSGAAINRKTGLLASVIWTIISADILLQANQPNCEVFINALLIGVFSIFASCNNKPMSPWQVIMAGLLLTLSTLFKQITIVFAVGILLVYVFIPKEKPVSRRTLLLHSLVICSMICITWVLVAAFFFINGHFQDFNNDVFVFNRSYSGSLLYNILDLRHFHSLFPECLIFTLPLVLISIFGILISRKYTDAKYRYYVALIYTYMVTAVIMIALPGYKWPHYYQFWLPVVSVGSAYAIFLLSIRSRRIAAVVSCIIIGWIICYELPYYAKSPQQLSQLKYGDEFVNAVYASEMINKTLLPNEILYDASMNQEIYFECRRRPPTSIFYSYPLVYGTLIEPYTQKVIADLESHPPDLIVDNTRFQDSKVMDWLKKSYVIAPPMNKYPPFIFYVKKNGRLYKEMNLDKTAYSDNNNKLRDK